MDYAVIAKLLLLAATQAPAIFQEAKALYTETRANFSETDQAAIDKAYTDSIAADEQKTDAALGELDEAAKN